MKSCATCRPKAALLMVKLALNVRKGQDIAEYANIVFSVSILRVSLAFQLPTVGLSLICMRSCELGKRA